MDIYCSIGKYLEDTSSCFKTIYCRGTLLQQLVLMDEHSRSLLVRRVSKNARDQFLIDDSSTVCDHHRVVNLQKYVCLQRVCCDPFKDHTGKHRKRSLIVVTEALANKVSCANLFVKPGQKLCVSCDSECRKMGENVEDMSTSDSGSDFDNVVGCVNESITALGCSPVKVNKVSLRDTSGYLRRKFTEAEACIESAFAEVAHQRGSSVSVVENTCIKCSDYECLIEKLKEKFTVCDKSTKIQILSLAPMSWTIEKTAEEFNCSHRLVKHARHITHEQGILPIPHKKKGHSLPADVLEAAQSFYENDEYSRVCPGVKDCLSVRVNGVKMKKAKRLLLLNLKDIFQLF